jgi:hypothetical protein
MIVDHQDPQSTRGGGTLGNQHVAIPNPFAESAPNEKSRRTLNGNYGA